MTLEAAITAPVTGQSILSWLYAHEQVVVFNCSWELRETFLRDIFEIRGMLHAWHAAEADRLYNEYLYEQTANDIFLDHHGYIMDADYHASWRVEL